MEDLYYVGLDIHKKSVSYCVKRAVGEIVGEGVVESKRAALEGWARSLPGPWIGAMEATLFTRWIYDVLVGFARELKVAHPGTLVALSAVKNKNDRKSASTIADLLRANLLPQIKMVSRQTFDLRQVLRLRSFVVRERVRMHNKLSGLLMEWGVEYERRRLKGKKYFAQLAQGLELGEDARELVVSCRKQYEQLDALGKLLVAKLLKHPILQARVERLRSVPGVGEITALTWALEIGEVGRIGSVKQAVSYCGLTSAQDASGGTTHRHRLSKKRNKRLQCVLIEAAKLGVTHDARLQEIYQRERSRSHANRATVLVARKLVAWLLAVDRTGKPFEDKTKENKQ